MPIGNSCFFSPFSKSRVTEQYKSALLLQFLIDEILKTHQAHLTSTPFEQILSYDARFFPYDWAHTNGHLNKAEEHISLLRIAFPKFKKATTQLEKILNSLITSLKQKPSKREDFLPQGLQNIYSLTEKLIEDCKEEENVIFFLLKNQKEIDALMGKSHLHIFLLALHPEGLTSLKEQLCDHFHDRGFFSVIPELKKLISTLELKNA